MRVLIIGGSTDIGINLAKYLLTKKYQVVVTYYNNPVELEGIRTLYLDVTNEVMIDRVISNLIIDWGRIDYIINLAAISMDNIVSDKSLEEFMKVLEVNLGGTFLVNKVYNKYISNGVIINMSSTDGINTYSKYNLDYASSKAGIITLSRGLAMTTSNKILCVCPNWINSDTTRDMNENYLDSELKRIKQDRLIEVDELVEAIYKIMKKETNSGDVFRIDIRSGKVWTTKV